MPDQPRINDVISVQPNGALGPKAAAAVTSASRGDVLAQREIFDGLACVAMTPGIDPYEGQLITVQAILMGRMLASHGGQADIRRLAGALLSGSGFLNQLGNYEARDHLAAEAISILEQLAECGDDLAAVSSATLLKPRSLEFVDRVRNMRYGAAGQEGA